VSRYDKYEPKAGGYRATLAADWPDDKVEHAVGVGHDAAGRLVIGAGVTGVRGVVVLTKARKAGEVVDVMTSGEIVEFGPSDAGSDAGIDLGVAATKYYAATNGEITATSAAGKFYVGHTTRGDRLIVRVSSFAQAS